MSDVKDTIILKQFTTRSFKKADGSRFYYFTSIIVSKDGREVVVSSQEKSRNKILRLLQEESVIWRTPKDATTSSAERQGLDYEQPKEAETATKGSGITPQSTSSDTKDTTNLPIEKLQDAVFVTNSSQSPSAHLGDIANLITNITSVKNS